MKREELLQKMINCYDTCTLDLRYSHIDAMNRVLELVEQELGVILDEAYEDDGDPDKYCGAV